MGVGWVVVNTSLRDAMKEKCHWVEGGLKKNHEKSPKTTHKEKIKVSGFYKKHFE